MTWVAVAIAGSAVLGAVTSSNASRQAANTQNDAAQRAQDTQLQMFQQNKTDLAPWTQGGGNAQQALMRYLGIGDNGSFDPSAAGVAPFTADMFQKAPGYDFRMREGENALTHQQSALGGLGGGNTMKALTRYGQDYATSNWQQALNNYYLQQGNVRNALSGVANTGANAAGMIAGLGGNAANNVSSLQYQQGNIGAQGQLAQANALNQGISGGLAPFLQAMAMQNQQRNAGPQNYLYNPSANPWDPSGGQFQSNMVG